jgi:hypothetical protein
MTSTTSAGTKIAVSISAPATEDAAGYAALTYTVIKGVESIPAFGATVAVNSFQPLDGPEEKHKGPVNYGSLDLPIASDEADAGQTILRTLGDPTNNSYGSFLVTYPSGAKRYFQGRVFGAPETVGGATNVLMTNPKVEISHARSIKVAAT